MPTTLEQPERAAEAEGIELPRPKVVVCKELFHVIGDCTLINADCREIVPELDFDSALTDPPYGIGKAEWDEQFPDWMWQLLTPAKFVGVMPGVWNMTKCPEEIGGLKYQWTLAAHLVNGMTRGAVGFGNWIPCLLYAAAASLKTAKAPEWCSRFADWCEKNGVTKRQLDSITGTSDMGGWWTSRLPHRSAIPTPAFWSLLKPALNAPDYFDEDVKAQIFEADGDCKNFVIGREDKPDHPSPKPLAPVQWFLSRVPGEVTLDPFMGSGTTAIACIRAKRKFIGIEKDKRHFETACERIRRELRQGVLL